ncbi:MAG: molybdate ABC transporter substrate-binding protein [Byssovorax sp.]
MLEPRPSLASVALLAAVTLLAPACKREVAVTSATPLKVAAASDLAFAFKDVGAAFEQATGTPVTFSFGSTGLLARQIAEGAPFDVFAAANVSFADDVVKQGACFADSKAIYGRGRVALWSRRGAPLPRTLDDLREASYVKIAIANPEHAPYGKAAKEALIKAGVWDAIEDRLVYGENIQQTLQFAQSGNADVALVALALALVTDGGFTAVDPALHAPLDQALVVCKGLGGKALREPTARQFTAFVNSDAGRAIMKRYGFLLPGESVAQIK